MDKTLVIMAAGLGSRYQGLKQIDPIGPNGELIVDYSIYDALQAGFHRIVFVIKESHERLFREAIGDRISRYADVQYAFQQMNDLPPGFSVPQARKKPWGTAHAVLSCRNVIKTPFATINADDYYGPSAFGQAAKWLQSADLTAIPYHFCMVGYVLKNTLTENGHVSRGVCEVNRQQILQSVTELVKIQRRNGLLQYTADDGAWRPLDENHTVSMNFWCFSPAFFAELEAGFTQFLQENQEQLAAAEYYLPSAVCRMIQEKRCLVQVLPTQDQWFGVTYREDREVARSMIRQKTQAGIYPASLWA